jgi:hypothetical protein
MQTKLFIVSFRLNPETTKYDDTEEITLYHPIVKCFTSMQKRDAFIAKLEGRRLISRTPDKEHKIDKCQYQIKCTTVDIENFSSIFSCV